MPKKEEAIPVVYPENLQEKLEDSKNPWATLEDLAHDKPAYSIDEGDYHYKQASAMNNLSKLAKQAQSNGDSTKVEYYESLMRNILKNDPISITGEDFDRLNDQGKLHYFHMGELQASLLGNKEGVAQYNREYNELAKRLRNSSINTTKQTTKNTSESLENKPLNQRVQFHFSDADARKSLVSVMKISSLPSSTIVYNAFSKELPDDMEQKVPTGYLNFGLNFFKKQIPEYNDSPSSLKELFDSEDYKKIALPCIQPQEKNVIADKAMDFIHCFNPNKKDNFGGFGEQANIDCRFYLCPKPDNLVPIMNAFVQKNDEADLPYYFKFGLDPKRNDKLVIYSGGEIAEKQLSILESIQNEHPEWFEGSGKNPLWGNIEGIEDVYYGAQPKTNQESYGQKRANLFYNAMSKWKKENGIKWNNKTIKPEDITDEQVKRFKKLFANTCRENGIEPKDFATTR